MQYLTNIINRFISDSILNGDQVVLKKYYNLIGFQFIIFFTSVFYTIDAYSKGIIFTMYSVMVPFFMIIISLVFLLKSNRYKLAGHLAILSTFLTFYFANFAAGFGPTSQLAWFFLFPILPTILLGSRIGALWTAASIIAVLTTVVLAHSYPFASEYTPELIYLSTLTDFLFGPIIVFILTQFGFGLKDTLIKEFQLANEKLHEAHKEKQVLLSILFHDLNNHLAVISVSAEVIKSNLEDEFLIHRVNQIEKSINAMNDITTNVRTLEKIKQGKADFTCSCVDLYDIYKDAKNVFESKLQSKSIELEFQNENNLSTLVSAEKVSLTNNVFYNIISNSIKFSYPNSKITISIVSSLDERIVVSVKDSGIGIPKEMYKNLFSFSTMTNRKGTSGEKGTGFGLPILEATIKRMNATVEVISQSEVDGYKECFTQFIMTFNKAK